jgi:hypothetical protein
LTEIATTVHNETSSENINEWLENYEKVLTKYNSTLEANSKKRKNDDSESESESPNQKLKKKKQIISVKLF